MLRYFGLTRSVYLNNPDCVDITIYNLLGDEAIVILYSCRHFEKKSRERLGVIILRYIGFKISTF